MDKIKPSSISDVMNALSKIKSAQRPSLIPCLTLSFEDGSTLTLPILVGYAIVVENFGNTIKVSERMAEDDDDVPDMNSRTFASTICRASLNDGAVIRDVPPGYQLIARAFWDSRVYNLFLINADVNWFSCTGWPIGEQPTADNIF